MISKRIYGLDILRTIAISSVMLTHSGWFLPDFLNIPIQKYTPDGVALFFVLSGFLIGNILIRSLNTSNFDFIALKTFWFKRWFRTLPAYYVVIICMLIILFFLDNFPTTQNILRTSTFTQSFIKDESSFFPEGWSLCIEEWFYLLIPFGIYIFLKLKNLPVRRIVIFMIIFIILLTTIVRVIYIHINYPSKFYSWDIDIRKSTILRLDSIMFGFLGAYVKSYTSLFKFKNLAFILGLLLFLFIEMNILKDTYDYLLLTLESIATLFVIPKLYFINSGKGFIFRIITFVSTISYSLYLVHGTIFYKLIYPIFDKQSKIPHSFYIYKLQSFLLFYISAFVLGIILHKTIELPFMKWRDKIISVGFKLPSN